MREVSIAEIMLADLREFPISGGRACNAIHRRRQILCQVVDPQPFRFSNTFRTIVDG
ncbi:MAG TPA: hypothetical protein VMM79_11775 [Longimicrobiales bacterium]|nr:hypothetical protein [Longimicrobiales bacterium]